jgi:hypothetical protein
MNAELLYTSAPQGLKQGSRGFCTVLSTVGMPLNLATKIESLSGYRHLYPSGTPDASKNPVGFSHLRFMIGGRHVSVLSRISDYGLDYSKRTNKLAHHIIVDAPMPTCGPAALLAEPSVMRDHWDGQCTNIPSPPALPNLSSEPQICRKWEAITGDAGWGGVVADAWLSTSPRPLFIIFTEHQSQELLGLMKESIALLPPNKRWLATFGTYVTTLPPDVDCRVRCVVAGSDEARMAIARGTVIDLTINLNEPAHNEAIEAARKGLLIGGDQNDFGNSSQLDNPKNESIQSITEPVNDQNLELELTHIRGLPVQVQQIGIPPVFIRSRNEKRGSISDEIKDQPNVHKKSMYILAVAISVLCILAATLPLYITNTSWINRRIDEVASIVQEQSATASQKQTSEEEKQPSPMPLEWPKEQQNESLSYNELPIDRNEISEEEYTNLAMKLRIDLKNCVSIESSQFAKKGQMITSALTPKKGVLLTENETVILNSLKDRARFHLIENNGTTKKELESSTSDSLIVPGDIDTNEYRVATELYGIQIKSEALNIVDPLKSSDIELKLIGPVYKRDQFDFCFPGSRLSVEASVLNSAEKSRQYILNQIQSFEYSWELLDKDRRSIRKIGSTRERELLLPENLPGNFVSVSVEFEDRLTLKSIHPLPLISEITGRLIIGGELNILVELEEPAFTKKAYVLSYGNMKMNSLQDVDSLVSGNDVSEDAVYLRKLLSSIRKIEPSFKQLLILKEKFEGVLKSGKRECSLLKRITEKFSAFETSRKSAILFGSESKVLDELMKELSYLNELRKEYDRLASGAKPPSMISSEIEKFVKSRFPDVGNRGKKSSRESSVAFDEELGFLLWYGDKSVSAPPFFQKLNTFIDETITILEGISNSKKDLDVKDRIIIVSPREEFQIKSKEERLDPLVCKAKFPISLEVIKGGNKDRNLRPKAGSSVSQKSSLSTKTDPVKPESFDPSKP